MTDLCSLECEDQRKEREMLGLGIDIIEVSRIQHALGRHGSRFITRLLTPDEQALLSSRRDPHIFVASRWAAKEATVKALGVGLRGMSWVDIEILHDTIGAPYVQLRGAAYDQLRARGAQRVWVSLSHTRETVVAVAILTSGREI